MKYLLILLLIILVAVGLLVIKTGEHAGDQPGDAPVTGLPWQIERLPDGSTRVFGITPGQTTLDEAIERLGDTLELAVIAAPHESGSLEAYYRHYSAGPITGSLILVLDVAGDALTGLRNRGLQDAGTRRYLLHPDDLPAAYRAPVRVITFMPSLNLDEAIAQTRFGDPAEVVQVEDRQQHWLYPALGLDLVLNADGKDLLQYLSPGAFTAHRVRLQEAAAAGQKPPG
jgi:hypothetical protein